MAKAPVVAGAVLVVVGGAGLGYALTRKPTGGLTPESSAAMATAMGQLDSEIRVAKAALGSGAKRISENVSVSNVIGTDAATAKNMEGRELLFKAEPDEVIELGQIPAGGKIEKLLVIPENAARSAWRNGEVGPPYELVGDKLVVAETKQFPSTSKDFVGKFVGVISVSRALDLKPAISRLVGAGVVGRLELNGQSLPIGALPADARTEDRPVDGVPNAKVVVAVPAATGGPPMALVGGGAGAAGLGLILMLIGMMMRGSKDGSAQPQSVMSTPTIPALGTAETQYSSSNLPIATGTQSRVDTTGATQAAIGTVSPGEAGPGSMIGRWEVVRRLGSGGMADVYLARAKGEAGFEKLVALKVMHSFLARNHSAVELFLDEARLAARVHHPNVVAIQDLGKIGNDYAIVMEYVDGIDLERLLMTARPAGRLVPVDVALGIICKVCDGLHAAHTATGPDGAPLGLIHRDVKSANVLVSKQGGVKVVDFGIAKAAKQSHLTQAGETKGTPSMMAPEQRVGDQVDVRVDVFSTAAVAYEVLTGQQVNLDLAALAHLGLDNWPHLPLPSTQRPGLPKELDAILFQAMAFERDKRPADCAALEASLEAVMKKHGLSASDKDIARWVDSELRAQPAEAPGVATDKTLGA
ncbi:MAG: serine/threonine-protein kinase [Kofleriaceae bacterium]